MGQESGARPRISAIKITFGDVILLFYVLVLFATAAQRGQELSPASLAPDCPAAAQAGPARLQQLRAEFQSAPKPPARKAKAMVRNC